MPAPAKPIAEEVQRVRREPRPWTGKVHNPVKLFEAEQAAKKSMTMEQFQKFTKEGIDKRFITLEKQYQVLEELVKESFAELSQRIVAAVNAK